MYIHVVTHTHWNREWYRTYEKFRIFLVELFDNLLERLQSPNYDYFHRYDRIVDRANYLNAPILMVKTGKYSESSQNEGNIPNNTLMRVNGEWHLPVIKSNQILTLKLRAWNNRKAG